jgi:Ca2+-binding EF-hand superfamily protein
MRLVSLATLLVVSGPTALAFAPLTIRNEVSSPCGGHQEHHLKRAPPGFLGMQQRNAYPYSSVKRAASSPEIEVDIKRVHKDADTIFSVIDIDGDGTITLEELSTHMTKAGYASDVVGKIFSKFDINKDGGVSRDEFRAGLLQFSPLRSAPGLGNYNSAFVKEIHADADFLFRSIDTDKSGSISKKELQEHLKQASKYTSAAVDNIFAALTLNDGGESSKLGISKEDLRDAFVRNSALRQAIGEGPNYK